MPASAGVRREMVRALLVILAAATAHAEHQQQTAPPIFDRLRFPSLSSNNILDWRPKLPQLPALPDFGKALFSRLPKSGVSANLRDDGFEPSQMMLELTADGDDWKLAVEKAGVRVSRRSLRGSPYDEIRGTGIIKVPPSVVLALVKMADEDIVRQYNPLYDRGYDLQEIDGTTKVSYASARAIFPFKPRDTVTRVAFRELPASVGGGTAVFQRAVKHPDMPKRSGFVRAEIVRGMFLIQPIPKQPGVTNFTFTQQINAGGIVPAWLMNKLVAQDGVALFQRLSATAQKLARNPKRLKGKKR